MRTRTRLALLTASIAGAVLLTVAALAQNQFPTPNGSGTSPGGVGMVVRADGNAVPADTVATYRATSTSFVPTAGGTLLQIQGSATKTIKIKRVAVRGVFTTADTGFFTVGKRTAAEGGSPVTGTAPTRVPLDSQNAAATATFTLYTTAGTPGTTIGNAAVERVFFGTLTTLGETARFSFEPRAGQSLFIRGTGEFVSVSSSFTSYTGANFSLDVEWTEE